MQNKNKYLIFDYDGVLGNTWNAAIKSIAQTNNITNEEASKHILNHTKKPIYAKSNNLSEEEILKNQSRIIKLNLLMMEHKFNLFEEFLEEIAKISDTKLAIVSSGSAEMMIKPSLKSHPLKFTHILGIEHHNSKEEKIEQICADWKISVKDVYYFTDTTTDVYELEQFLDFKKIIGCSWGWHGYELLSTILPDAQILNSFSDIHRLFQSTNQV